MASTFPSSYEDTLNSMRTSKGNESTLGALRRYMDWSSDGAVLPSAGAPTSSAEHTSWLTWPGASSSPPFYETFGLTLMQRYMAFGLCILGAFLLLFLVKILTIILLTFIGNDSPPALGVTPK